MDDTLKRLVAENRGLTESRRPVVEHLVGVPQVVGVVAARESGDKPGTRFAIVGEVDRGNSNLRVYPRGQWLANVDRINAAGGGILGAVDHAGPLDGGNLRSSPIVWKRLEILDDGRVRGEFVLVEEHDDGRNLAAVIRAGGKVGFSTFGYASAHSPSNAERKRYGRPPAPLAGEDDGYVVIDDWDLIKIDAVDNPSVRTAFLIPSEAADDHYGVHELVRHLWGGSTDLPANGAKPYDADLVSF